ncbi:MULTISPECIES: helix-turn-helix domain-containing protein [unclassified Burkholderia]|uniref:helix-turn-helix domain-containing protein n=1 Tax=unclassified Burkholderia TaxID=2613784 RepID=UPI002AB10CB8|nr:MULTISPECIES: helix-turn-helix domain-containing protein [unclassified Burkholderia]
MPEQSTVSTPPAIETSDRNQVIGLTAEDTLRNARGDAPLLRSAVVNVAYDADEQARNLIGSRQTYDQLAAGCFVGTLTQLPLDTIQLFHETTSHALRQVCEVCGDAYWFGIPLVRDHEARLDARRIDVGTLACQPSNTEFELLTPARFSIHGVVVRGDALRLYSEQIEQCEPNEPLLAQSVMKVGEAQLARLCALLARRLHHAVTAFAPISDAQQNILQAEVLAALFDVCVLPLDNIPGAMQSRRRRIVDQARDYMLAHRTRPVGVPELCAQLHVSRRTLQYCFQDVLGMAPTTYLRALRLNGARRDLCGDTASSVQDVAAAWGFSHLGQFATDYRRLFGKRPSETLRDKGRWQSK